MRAKALSYDEVSEVFELIDGVLWRRQFVKADGRQYSAKRIHLRQTNPRSYCTVQFKDFNVQYHRLVWVLYNRCNIPEGLVIDHINGDRFDNRPQNLRLATHRENCQNLKKHREGRLVGCHYRKDVNKWQAILSVCDKRRSLGYFDTQKEAHEAYLKAVQQLEG